MSDKIKELPENCTQITTIQDFVEWAITRKNDFWFFYSDDEYRDYQTFKYKDYADFIAPTLEDVLSDIEGMRLFRT